MASIKDRINAVRARVPIFDHLMRMQEHIGKVKANQQAGAITYFGFISIFPVLALAFAVMGFVVRINPFSITATEVNDKVVAAINAMIPQFVYNPDNPPDEIPETAISIAVFQDGAPAIFSIGLILVLYSGLGWLSAMRNALIVVFQLPSDEHPNFVLGKLRDLMSLALIGVTMILAVSVAGIVSGASEWLLELFGLAAGMEWFLTLLAVAVGLIANTVLFFAIFRLLARPPLPTVSLWKGAFLGAVGFELLKQLAVYLIGSTKEQPAFQVFGLALILVVWIFYFARVLMYAAAFAHTGPLAVAEREAAAAAEAAAREAELEATVEERAAVLAKQEAKGNKAAPFGAGVATAVGVAAVLKKFLGE